MILNVTDLQYHNHDYDMGIHLEKKLIDTGYVKQLKSSAVLAIGDFDRHSRKVQDDQDVIPNPKMNKRMGMVSQIKSWSAKNAHFSSVLGQSVG